MGQEKKQKKIEGGQIKRNVWAAAKYAVLFPLAQAADAQLCLV